MYTIGEFSRIGMISTSALRFYDEIGLLKPSKINRFNGYRYYSEDQVEDIHFITEMREYEFSLEEIKGFIGSNKINLVAELQKKHEKLFWKQQKILYVRRKLKERIKKTQGADSFMEINNKANKLEIKVASKDKPIKTVGISINIPAWPPEDASIFGDLWSQYWDRDVSSKISNKIYPSVRYGILAFTEAGIQYIVADAVSSYEDIPEGLVTFDIPKGEYAVCTFNGETFDEMVNSSMQRANDYLLTTWLPKTEYKHAESFSLEVYDDRSRKKEYPEMDIMQPIVKKG
ncbi:MerR family transcriptional regulator [Alkaliphilus pronyensis]|uniref:MerR family transcriptional regulator n=1 Tax=Alkaliphilus pronyensis TaxID=1482732 RepID=UPI0018657FCC|nr:MerR family transcriptional regulator [Alkaliphilus pronyensis]